MYRTGIVNLPLHSGKAPRWLFERMVKLAEKTSNILIYEFGQKEFLNRMSNPFWFQAFSCVLGFDWHSSGTTTTTCGALKFALNRTNLGIRVAGGKGKASRKSAEEIEKFSNDFSLSTQKIEEMKYSSKMSAKVDNVCVQDGYQLYHHCFFFTEKGDWIVVQQGMNENYARRYHWLYSNVKTFIEEPHAAICCDRIENEVLDMTSKESRETRKISLDLINDNPIHLKKYFLPNNQSMLTDFFYKIENFSMPKHHPIFNIDIGKNGIDLLQKVYEIQPKNYEELVAFEGMGPKKIRALALISNLIFGSKISWKDPVKYTFTHGGKDGFPYPVDKETYDHSIQILEDCINQAKLNEKEKITALKRLNSFVENSTLEK
jgi:hypothetical protein